MYDGEVETKASLRAAMLHLGQMGVCEAGNRVCEFARTSSGK